MTIHAEAPKLDIEAFLRSHERKSLLRFITCGSVDDGKSTLIGRLLHETNAILDDQLSAVEADSRRHALIVSLLGVRHVIVAVNKMDLIGWSEDGFSRIEAQIRAFARSLDFERNFIVSPLRPQKVQWCFSPHQQPRDVSNGMWKPSDGSRTPVARTRSKKSE